MRKLCIFAAGFTLAAAAWVFFDGGLSLLLFGAGLTVMAAVLFFLRGKAARRAAICALGLGLGLLWCAGYERMFLSPLRSLPAEADEFSAAVIDTPRPTRYGYSVLTELDAGGRKYKATVYYDDADTAILPGDRITGTGKLRRTDSGRDSDVYYSAHGVRLAVSANKVFKTSAPPFHSPRTLAAKLGALLYDSVQRLFAQDTRGFLGALLTGNRLGLTYYDKSLLSVAGIYHCIAVSGMHISILFGMIVLLCGSNKRLAAVIGLPAVWFFILMTGASAAAIRAGIMLTMLLLAPLLSREADAATSFFTALFLLILENPWAVANVSLQLSFSSTAGILLFSPRLYRAMANRLLPRKKGKRGAFFKIGQVLLGAFSCSIASTVFSMPFAAYHFETVSLLYPLTNMLCLWLVSGIFTAGLLTGLLGMVCAPAAMGLAWLLNWPVRYVLLIVRLIAAVPHAALYLQNAYVIAFAVFLYAAEIALAVRPEKLRIWAVCLCGAALLALCLGLSRADYHGPAFTFTALDEGQGQCLILNQGTDTTVIDCGGTVDESGERAARFLQTAGEFTVERAILTHYDADHVNGICQLLRRERVKALYLPDVDNESELRLAIEQTAAARGTEIIYVRADTEIALPNGKLQIFAPISAENDNDAGLCVLASAGKYDILVTGDLAEQAEYRLLSLHDLGDVDLLVAGHHGSRYSTSTALLNTVLPETVLISVGADNRFGHPGEETLERIAALGAAIYRTDVCGTITIRG